MTSSAPVPRTPWILARCAQAAIAAAAVQDVFRVLAIRTDRLHPSAADMDRVGTTSEIFVYLMTAAIPLFLVWLARCRRNVRILSPGAAPVSGFWSVAAWFIPFANWWVPRGFVLDVERASARAAGRKSGDLLVNVWWGAWFGHMATEFIAQSINETGLAPLVLEETLMIAAAVLAVLVIERVTRLQAAALRGSEPVPGVPAIESA